MKKLHQWKWRYVTIGFYLLTMVFLCVACSKNEEDKGKASESVATEGEEGSLQEDKEEVKEKDKGEDNLKELRLAITTESNDLTGILLLADQQNYLKEELEAVGYKLKVYGFAQAGPAINEAFAGKSIDISIYGNLPPVVLKSNGVDVSIVAMNDSELDQCIVVPKDSKIQSVKDLKGKSVICGKGTILDEYLRRVLKVNDLKYEDVSVINDVATATSTFSSGNADALAISYTQALLVNEQFPIRFIVSTRDSNKELASQTVLVARNEFLQDHPDVMTAFLKAYIRGYQYAIDNKEEALNAFVNDKVSRDIVDEVYGSKDQVFSNLSGEITDKDINRLQELDTFLFENGLISESVNLKELVNDSFYKEALAEVSK
ncbi:ABC transporter substrate-binding protein [Anaerosporobacter sp.]